MKYNYSYGKLNDGRITYAPAVITDGSIYIVSPTPVDYITRGWKKVVDPKPTDAPQGFHWVPTRWVEESEQIVRLYTLVDDPPAPPRKFSKLKLYAALTSAGLWDALESWLKTQTVEGVNAYTAFSLAQDLSDAHPLFSQYYAAAKSVLGVTDEQAEAILAASEED